MQPTRRHRLCSLIIIITFSTAVCVPQQLWGSWEEDAWEDSKEGLKITGIVVGSILVVSLLIVLIVGTIEEVSDDEIIWMKNTWEQSLHTSFLGPKGLQDAYTARQNALDFTVNRHHALGGLRCDEIFLPSPPAPSLFAYALPFSRPAHRANSRLFSLNLGQMELVPVLNEKTDSFDFDYPPQLREINKPDTISFFDLMSSDKPGVNFKGITEPSLRTVAGTGVHGTWR